MSGELAILWSAARSTLTSRGAQAWFCYSKRSPIISPGRLKLPRRWPWLMHRRYKNLVQPRRRVSTKPRGKAGEENSKARIAFSMLEMPFCSHQIMRRSSGPIPTATCRHSRGLFEKSWDISGPLGHFVWRTMRKPPQFRERIKTACSSSLIVSFKSVIMTWLCKPLGIDTRQVISDHFGCV
jgi:hypothetical protein